MGALLNWPKFSMASFLIASRLNEARVHPKTVIDIGANVGQFAVAASRLLARPRIFSIEPDSKTAKTLRRNTQNENISITVAALGDFEGDSAFYVNRDSQVSSMLALGEDRVASFPNSTVEREEIVRVTTLDSLFLNQDLNSPILVKIDVQGFEDRVIRGGRNFLAKVEWVLVEISFADLYKGELTFAGISALLGENGFRFVRPLNFHISPTTGEIIEMDALFQKSVES